MTSQLISARIRGIRSYSPREDHSQVIDFMPLTLIVGNNGTGKTSIIEALKFMIGGDEPPHSDSRRNFIHTPKDAQRKGIKLANEHSYAAIEIEFKTTLGDTCLARREISTTGSTAKNSPPQINSGYKINKGHWCTVNRLDDWTRLLPKLFGIPNQAILSHVILCHQEDNLWCMGESSTVKLLFDKIFGCEQYKKEIKHIEDEIRACKREIELGQKDIDMNSGMVRRKQAIMEQIQKLQDDFKQGEVKAEALEIEIEQLRVKKETMAEDLKVFEANSQELIYLKKRVKELSERDAALRRSLQPLLDRSNTVTERRPPPPPPSRPKKKNKPKDQDPTALDLIDVASKVAQMQAIVNGMPDSEELRLLKNLIGDVDRKIGQIKTRFEVHIEEEEKEDEEEEDVQRQWYEQQEALSRAAEARRIEENRQIRESIESSIRDNLVELDRAKKSLEEMEEKNRAFANISQKKYQLRDMEQLYTATRDKRYVIVGSNMQIEKEMKKLEAESRNYKGAHINYSNSLARVICNREVQKDLEKLKLCFHESICSFHDTMIVKINEALKSRWKQIYQGGDIEFIEVVAEEITRGKDKKSFNYYMAMRKGGTRMVMREKSSAGQKALASIILRMTLAELFVRDFTFIALDEPTANLDSSNVQSLAKSIGSYVRRRTKKGANIQWVIITHDEQFLRALDEESSPFFYRIRLTDDGYSQINKISCLETNFEDKVNE